MKVSYAIYVVELPFSSGGFIIVFRISADSRTIEQSEGYKDALPSTFINHQQTHLLSCLPIFAIYTNSFPASVLCLISPPTRIQWLVFHHSPKTMLASGHWVPQHQMVHRSQSLSLILQAQVVRALSLPTFVLKSTPSTSKMVGNIAVRVPSPQLWMFRH